MYVFIALLYEQQLLFVDNMSSWDIYLAASKLH